MSVNVIERLLIKAPDTTTLAPKLVDEWETGQRLQILWDTCGKTFKAKVPAAWPERKVMMINQDTMKQILKRAWIVDSGASIHLISLKDLTRREGNLKEKLKDR